MTKSTHVYWGCVTYGCERGQTGCGREGRSEDMPRDWTSATAITASHHSAGYAEARAIGGAAGGASVKPTPRRRQRKRAPRADKARGGDLVQIGPLVSAELDRLFDAEIERLHGMAP